MAEVRSIDIIDFKYSITKFVEENHLPLELKRMVVKDILSDLSIKAENEVYSQAEEREKAEG